MFIKRFLWLRATYNYLKPALNRSFPVRFIRMVLIVLYVATPLKNVLLLDLMALLNVYVLSVLNTRNSCLIKK